MIRVLGGKAVKQIRRRLCACFTLIELRVVVASIAVLVALLLPALGAGAAGAASGTPQASGPNVYLYDMGSDKTPVWPGFTQATPMTAYAAERGYGWERPQSVLRTHAPRHLYRSADMVGYLDALSIDDISGTTNHTVTFRIDVPNGEYVVWVLTGRMGRYHRLRYLLRPHDLLLQGKRVVRITAKPNEMFRMANYDWAQDDVYERFVGSRFAWLHQEISVKTGHLKIGFSRARDFPVCAIVVARADKTEHTAERLRQIDRQRKAVFDRFWREVRPDPDDPAAATDDEKQRGYIVAATDCGDDLFPWSQPAAEADRSRIKVVAALGEQHQASFAVYALRELRDVQYEVTDLRGASGGSLRTSVVERGLVQFTPWSFHSMKKKGYRQYQITPLLILPARPMSIAQGTCRRFWLTLRVPDNAVAGIYKGKIRISAAGAPSATLELWLRVLPFKLIEPPLERFVYFGTMYYAARSLMPKFKEAGYWESLRAEVRFLKDNQFTRAQAFVGPVTVNDGKVEKADFTPATYKLMEIIRQENAMPRDNIMICLAGRLNNIFGGYWKQSQGVKDIKFAPTKDGLAGFVEAVRRLNDKAEKAGWPEVVFEVGGEYNNYGLAIGTEFGLAAHGALKAAGVSTALRANGPADLQVIREGLVDYPCPARALMARPKRVQLMKSRGKRFWIYALGYRMSQHRTYRFGSGWYCFKHGVTRVADEEGIYFNGQPGNYFDADTDFPMALPTSLTSFAPTVRMKRIVQGAYDYKYLHTLEKLTGEAEGSQDASVRQEARSAREWLKEMLEAIPDGLDPATIYDQPYGHRWSNESLDLYRWLMARRIMALRKALGMEQ